MQITVNTKTYTIGIYHFAYVSLIILFSIFTMSTLAYNTAFVDEAIYATVGEGALRGIYWEAALSWMSGSYIYPVMSAFINRSFGLYGVRMLSVIFILISGIVTSYFGYRLAKMKGALLTLFVYLTSSVTMDLAQIGTYDAPAVFFFSMSLVLAYLSKHTSSWKRFLYAIFSGVFISLAILTKYIFILFLPTIGLILFFIKRKFSFSESFVWAAVVHSIISLFAITYLDALIAFFNSQAFSEPKTREFIMLEIIRMTSIGFVGAIGSLFVLPILPKKKRLLISIFILSGFLPVLYHVGSENFRSIWKHLVMSMFFWAPVTSYLIIKTIAFINKSITKTVLIKNTAHIFMILAFVLVTAHLWRNAQNHWRFQRSWPSASAVITYLEKNRKSDDRIFAEGSAIYKYHLFDGFEDPFSWTSTWYIEYQGKTGTEAMKLAINDRAFDYIIFNNYFTPYQNSLLLDDIEKNYELVLTVSYKVSGVYDNDTFLWKPKDDKLSE